MPTAFLSTLSLRRATPGRVAGSSLDENFYPRSPCGERLEGAKNSVHNAIISIHALLAESDFFVPCPCCGKEVISIHALLAESDERPFHCFLFAGISIHALLAESDQAGAGCPAQIQHFYPRSPCGERLVMDTLILANAMLFLSTLSLRRATRTATNRRPIFFISIHALLAESDILGIVVAALRT